MQNHKLPENALDPLTSDRWLCQPMDESRTKVSAPVKADTLVALESVDLFVCWRWILEEERFFCVIPEPVKATLQRSVVRRCLLGRRLLCRQQLRSTTTRHSSTATCWGRTSTGRSSTSPAISRDHHLPPSKVFLRIVSDDFFPCARWSWRVRVSRG